MKLHYKTRNTIFYKLRLWPVVLIQSRLRQKLYPGSENAALWVQIARSHYVIAQKKNLFRLLKKRLFGTSRIRKLISKISAQPANDLTPIVNCISQMSDDRDDLEIFLEGLIGKLVCKSEAEESLRISYAKMAYQYYSQKAPDQINKLIKGFIYSYPDKQDFLTGWAEWLGSHKFYKVTQDGYEEQYDFSFASKSEITVIAENYEIALGSLATLPRNCLVKFYLISEHASAASYNHFDEYFRQQVEFYNLLESVVSPWSEINFLSVNNASELAKRIFISLKDHLEILECGYDISMLKDASELCLEDLTLHSVKIITAIYSLFKNSDNIYLSLGANDNLENYLFSLLNLISKKNIFISAFSYTEHNELNIRQNVFTPAWHTEYIEPLLNSQFSKKEGEKGLKHISRRDFDHYKQATNLFGFDKEYVLCSVNLRDDNYSKAAKAAICELLQHTAVIVLYHFTNDKKVKNFIREVKSKSGSDRVEFVPYSPSSFENWKYRKQYLWQTYILNQILSPELGNDKFVVNGIDYKFVIKHGVKNFLLNYLPAKIRLNETFTESFKAHGKPKSALLMPMRTSFTWLFADILKKNDIRILDQQVLFQSNHPRYKASKGNVVSLLNDEQVEIYKATFPVMKGQEITKYGSILYKLIQDRIKLIDIPKTKEIHKLPARDKIIVVATQNTLSDEFLTITSHIAKIAAAQKDVFVVIKLHPKEDPSYIAAYQEVINSGNATEKCLVTTSADMYEMVKVCDILVTIFSNVGMEAALSGKDVIVANLNNMEMPVDLAKQGLAIEVKTPEELESAITSLLKNSAAINLKNERDKFIKANIELVDGKVLERITQYLVA